MHQALIGLACLLLPGITPESTAARARQRELRTPLPLPYLVATGPPTLRFQALEVPPEPVLRPVANGPPVPGLTAEETVVAVANTEAVQMPRNTGPPKSVSAAAPPSKPAPRAILPDDTRPAIRAEEFLPYFQVPGSLPPSSATYTQTPR